MSTPLTITQLATKTAFGYSGDFGLAARYGRQRMQQFSSFLLASVEAWPYATDRNGQSYPAGLVAVRQRYTLGVAQSVPGPPTSTDLIPVPSILPAGYTHRWDRAHAIRPGISDPSLGQGYFSAGFQPLPPYSASLTNHRLRIGNALHDYYYLPESQGEDSYLATIGSSGWGSAPTAGLRYIQWKGVQPGITVELRCYADGHRGVGATTGDTSLALYTNGGGANADSPLFTTGLTFPLGTKRYLYFKISPAPPDIITLIAGPRVDIPLPWTCTGPTNLVAPGGYVAGALDVALPS